jgi:hypothetical protein
VTQNYNLPAVTSLIHEFNVTRRLFTITSHPSNALTPPQVQGQALIAAVQNSQNKGK